MRETWRTHDWRRVSPESRACASVSFTYSYENHVYCFMVYLSIPFLSEMRKYIYIFKATTESGNGDHFLKGKVLFFPFSVAILNEINLSASLKIPNIWKCTYLRLCKIKSNIFQDEESIWGN